MFFNSHKIPFGLEGKQNYSEPLAVGCVQGTQSQDIILHFPIMWQEISLIMPGLSFEAAEDGNTKTNDVFVSLLQAFLLNEDLGDSLDSVEALLKKHEDFEKSLSAQEEKITVRHLHQGITKGARNKTSEFVDRKHY